MSREAVAAQAASAFDAVLHLRRSDRRYVAEVGVVRRAATGDLEVACAVRVDPSGATRPGPAWPALAARLGLPVSRAELGPSR
jgi:pilus assembly protein CpaF